MAGEEARRGIDVLFLPPYSPDFTPIEQAWNKLKTKLRQAQARICEALEEALHTAIDWITGPGARLDLIVAAITYTIHEIAITRF